jgi:hypothetical protein
LSFKTKQTWITWTIILQSQPNTAGKHKRQEGSDFESETKRKSIEKNGQKWANRTSNMP